MQRRFRATTAKPNQIMGHDYPPTAFSAKLFISLRKKRCRLAGKAFSSPDFVYHFSLREAQSRVATQGEGARSIPAPHWGCVPGSRELENRPPDERAPRRISPPAGSLESGQLPTLCPSLLPRNRGRALAGGRGCARALGEGSVSVLGVGRCSRRLRVVLRERIKGQTSSGLRVPGARPQPYLAHAPAPRVSRGGRGRCEREQASLAWGLEGRALTPGGERPRRLRECRLRGATVSLWSRFQWGPPPSCPLSASPGAVGKTGERLRATVVRAAVCTAKGNLSRYLEATRAQEETISRRCYFGIFWS